MRARLSLRPPPSPPLGLSALALIPAFALLACGGDSSTSGSGTTTTSRGECPACVTDTDCAVGEACGQFAGDTFCAPDCSSGQACDSGRACTAITTAEGKAGKLCVPVTDVCGSPGGAGGGGSGGGGAGGGGGSAGGGGAGGGVTGIDGGVLDTLSFAIVGDTRPAMLDDTAGYPTQVITKIWKGVEAQDPKPAFAVGTGDYMFAKDYGSQGAVQLDLYLGAKANFTNILFPAMGNHECTGATASNCGPSAADGETKNYKSFMSKMLAPLGVTKPYYTVDVKGTNGAWTAKLVFVAANAWNATQATWLEAELSKPTTYTFVVRHESSTATTAPGVTPSGTILKKHPSTIVIVGHTHKYAHYADTRQIVVGNGGAPLVGSGGYGYVVARQRADGAIVFKEYDYATNGVKDTFAVKADGSPAP